MPNKSMSAGGRRIAAVSASLALLAVLTACGSAGSGAGGEDTIKVMQIVDITSPAIVSYPQIAEAGKSAVADINARGGIDGKTIDLVTCDSKVDPNATTNCARQAVSEGVVAVIGTYAQNADKIIPILEQAKIPYIPAYAAAPQEFRSNISFPINSQMTNVAGLGVVTGRECKSTDIALIDAPGLETLGALMQAGLESEGSPEPTVISIPLSPGDYSGQAAQIVESGADCLIAFVGPANAAVLYPALEAAGFHGRIAGYQGNSISPNLIEATPDLLESALNVSFFIPYTDPKWDTYREIVAKYSDPKQYDFSTAGAQLAYLDYLVFEQVVGTILKDGDDVTAASLLAQLNKTSAAETGGLLPVLDFTQEAPIKDYPRMFNRQIAFEIVEGGEQVPLGDGQFVDLTAVIQSVFGKA